MNRTLRSLLLLLLVGVSGTAFAQNGGIDGTVRDPKGEPLPSVSVLVFQGGIQKAVTGTDPDGKYEAKPLNPGTYDVIFTNQGKRETVTGVLVGPDQSTRVDFKFEAG